MSFEAFLLFLETSDTIALLSLVGMQVSMIEIPCLEEVTIVLLETTDRGRRNATSAECGSELQLGPAAEII